MASERKKLIARFQSELDERKESFGDGAYVEMCNAVKKMHDEPEPPPSSGLIGVVNLKCTIFEPNTATNLVTKRDLTIPIYVMDNASVDTCSLAALGISKCCGGTTVNPSCRVSQRTEHLLSDGLGEGQFRSTLVMTEDDFCYWFDVSYKGKAITSMGPLDKTLKEKFKHSSGAARNTRHISKLVEVNKIHLILHDLALDPFHSRLLGTGSVLKRKRSTEALVAPRFSNLDFDEDEGEDLMDAHSR